MSMDIHDNFLDAVWCDSKNASIAELAAEYLRTFVAQTRQEIEDALPEQDGRWKTIQEIEIESAFGEKFSLAECQGQIVDLMCTNRKVIKEKCESEVKTAPKDLARILRARYWANELGFVINRNRPSVERIINILKEEN